MLWSATMGISNARIARYSDASKVLGDDKEYVMLPTHSRTAGLTEVNGQEPCVLQTDPKMGGLLLAEEEEDMIVLRDPLPHAVNNLDGASVAKPGGNYNTAGAVVSQEVEEAEKGRAGEEEEEQDARWNRMSCLPPVRITVSAGHFLALLLAVEEAEKGGISPQWVRGCPPDPDWVWTDAEDNEIF